MISSAISATGFTKFIVGLGIFKELNWSLDYRCLEEIVALES